MHQVLIIEADSTPVEASVHAALASDTNFRCRRLPWEAMPVETFTRRQPTGVVAVAVPPTPIVSQVLHRWRDRCIVPPTLAVLPRDVDEPLLRVASEAVDDFMLCPVRAPELRQRLTRLLDPWRDEVEAVSERLIEEMGLEQLVGKAPGFLAAVQQVPRLARSDMPVLITGETGTGKELFARAIHHLGPRRDSSFLAVDCAAIPDHLFESELFGHVRGAYTDAHRDQPGQIALADGGTLFLDEIDALSLSVQAKLLRFLQDRTFRPLGARRFVRADVNIIAATNREMEICIRDGQFRSDLYFRLNVLRLHLPALRERAGDIPRLAAHFLRELRQSNAAIPRSFSAAALRKLAAYHWPGNVRQLMNAVHSAAVLSDGAQISADQVRLPVLVSESVRGMSLRQARTEAVAAFERRYLEELLHKHGGNITRAAREAQTERRALGRLIKKHHINPRSF